MAKSVDDLIEFLLEEIALSGSRGESKLIGIRPLWLSGKNAASAGSTFCPTQHSFLAYQNIQTTNTNWGISSQVFLSTNLTAMSDLSTREMMALEVVVNYQLPLCPWIKSCYQKSGHG
jgi:hypothetical protein